MNPVNLIDDAFSQHRSQVETTLSKYSRDLDAVSGSVTDAYLDVRQAQPELRDTREVVAYVTTAARHRLLRDQKRARLVRPESDHTAFSLDAEPAPTSEPRAESVDSERAALNQAWQRLGLANVKLTPREAKARDELVEDALDELTAPQEPRRRTRLTGTNRSNALSSLRGKLSEALFEGVANGSIDLRGSELCRLIPRRGRRPKKAKERKP